MKKHIEIRNSEGCTLRGYLEIAPESEELVIFFHGYTGSIIEANNLFLNFSNILIKNGISTLRMNYMGNGESDGNSYDFNLGKGLDDAKDIIDYAASLGFKKIDLLGFSMGGMISANLCNYYPFNKIILWSAALSSSPNWKELSKYSYILPNDNFYVSGIEISKDVSFGLDRFNPLKEARKFKNKVLICFGTCDNTVDPKVAEEYHNAFAKSEIVKIEGASHCYEKFAEQKNLFESCLKFILK